MSALRTAAKSFKTTPKPVTKAKPKKPSLIQKKAKGVPKPGQVSAYV